jgi:heptosyltransferase-2
MLVTPAAAALVTGHPSVDRVEVDDKRGTGRGLRGLLALVGRLRARRYTLAVAAHKSWRTGIALRLAGIPRRIGFAEAPAAWLYTDRVARPTALHDRDRLLELLRPLGGADGDRRTWVALDEAARRRAAELLAPVAGEGRPLVGVCPGSVWRTKRWPSPKYGELVRRLEARGWRCVLLGSPDERTVTADVRAAAGGLGLDLAGATDLGVLAAVLARMSVVITNDSAPMHVASALDVPQVAIFCATVPAQGYGPVGRRALVVDKDLACRPCGRHGGPRCPRGTDDCMELVEVDEVEAAIARVCAGTA